MGVRIVVGGWMCMAALSVSALVAGPVERTVADKDAPQVSQLIERLSARSYSVREAATRKLTEIGVPAKDQLLALLKSPDAEVRTRARRILEVVLERDFQKRLRDFAADANHASGHGLPGWERYRSQYGDDAGARRLFLEMQRGEPALLDVAEASPRQAAETLETRMRQLQEGDWDDDETDVEEESAGRVAAMMFVAADPNIPLSEETASYVAGLVYRSTFQQAISSGGTSAAIRKVLGSWVRRPAPGGSGMRIQNLMLSLQFELPETLELSLSLIGDDSIEPYLRPYPIVAVAKFGNRQHLPALTRLLGDHSPCGEYDLDDDMFADDDSDDEDAEAQPPIQCQVRDVALAAMIRLTGQSLTEYGFEEIDNDEGLELNLGELGFRTAADREQAHSQWRDWAARQTPAAP